MNLVYVVALLPIIATLKIKRKPLYATIVSLLYVTGALGPLLVTETLPVLLRIVHGVKILADYMVFGPVVVYLLGRKNSQHKK